MKSLMLEVTESEWASAAEYRPGETTLHVQRALYIPNSAEVEAAVLKRASVCLMGRVRGPGGQAHQWCIARFPFSARTTTATPLDLRFSMETLELRALVVMSGSTAQESVKLPSASVLVNASVAALSSAVDLDDAFEDSDAD
jgi:hypothetical protein